MPKDESIDSHGTARSWGRSPALAALVQRVVDGDVAALEALYDRCSPAVFGLASRLLGGHAEAVDQTVEEVFWQLWRQAPRLVDGDPVACAQALRTHLNEWALTTAAEASARHGLPPIAFAASLHAGAAGTGRASSPATKSAA